MKKKAHILILLILVLACGVRLCHLGHASLWLDELATVHGIDAGNPPTYLILTGAWMKIAGRGEAAARFPSLVFSLAAIPLLYLFGKRLFSAKAGLIAALLLAVSPYSVNYAQEARMYSLVWLLGLASFYFFYRFSRDGSVGSLIGCLAASALALYVSYSGLFFILAVNIIFFIFFNRRRLKTWLSSQLLLALLLLPLLPSLLEKASRRGGVNWIYLSVNYRDLFRGIFCYLGGDLSGMGTPLIYIPFLILIAAGYLLFQGRSARPDISPPDFFLAAWFILPILIGLAVNLFFFPFLTPLTIRYVGFIQFPFYLAAARGITRLRAAPAGIALSCLVLLAGIQLGPYYRDDIRIGGENWRELIAQLEKFAGREDLVILPPGTGLPLRYYGTGKIKNTRRVKGKGDVAAEETSRNLFVLYRNWRQRRQFRAIPGYQRTNQWTDGPIGIYRFKKQGTARNSKEHRE